MRGPTPRLPAIVTTLRPPASSGHRYQHIAWRRYDGWCDAALAGYLQGVEGPAELVARDPGGERSKGRNRVARVEDDGTVYWVKWFQPRGCFSSLRYLARRSKAEKAWDTAFALIDAGIATPRPLAGLCAAGWQGRLDAVLVFEDFADARDLSAALSAAGDRRAALLDAAGAFLARFHDTGFRHRDLQGGNLLVRERGGHYQLCLVDINRARRRSLTTEQRLRDLERLPLAPADLERFFRAYGGEHGDCFATRYRHRQAQRARLHALPRPLSRPARRLWYYWRELTAYRRDRP